MRELSDILIPRAKVLFVGINPGLRSSEIGHHFAGKGNPFWRLLHAAGLTPIVLRAEEDIRLPEFGLALTNLCPRPSRTAAELSRAEIAQGRIALRQKIEAWRPRIVAFVGLSIYQQFFGHAQSGGAGAKTETIADARVFVVPNPSGLNQSFPGFADKLIWFQQLAALTEADAALPTIPHT